MTEQERYKLEGLLAAKVKPSEAARELGFTVQTIYNEIRRGTYMHTVGYKDIPRYSAAKGQDIFEKRQRNKGRLLKIGYDHRYAEFLDKNERGNIFISNRAKMSEAVQFQCGALCVDIFARGYFV